ncbi:MAG: indolepyruvate ferredoxin oxidoreductase subunit alpha [Synergistaceae bacterium]|jgi:indolepyruvate ferredoxin oxidoreductase alpha subunit|nr:indolepyruvate ferredoxin oxidoreductase subunit alpha [Synergistaceae bacterium]
MRQIMTGNEAIARGAWEAGCRVAAAYPGTPSSEILENIAGYDEIDSEWSTNEKVALEVASGASIAGARSLAAMKHVGLNVAADPFFTMSYIGASGGLVVVTADDPGLFSSQNEQDNRWYALHAKTPMLEPSDSQECLDFIKDAFDISERFDAPVLFRVTTRICHSKSVVELGVREDVPVKPYERDPAKRVMTPAAAKARRYILEEREKKLREFSNECSYNKIEWAASRKVGVIASGIGYQHAREAFETEDFSYLKLGFTYPLPDELIRRFAEGVEKIYVVEENEPYIETFVKSLGIACEGRSLLPAVDELNAGIIQSAVLGREAKSGPSAGVLPPPRPPVLCPGCSHRGVFYTLSKEKDIVVSSDIGCYTLGVAPPLSVTDSVICMGASVSAGIGYFKAFSSAQKDAREEKPEKQKKPPKIFSVIGDSTFFHSGVTGLIDAVINKSESALLILDNRTTAMTGHQENPGTGFTIKGDATVRINLRDLCAACGVRPENVRTVDSYDISAVTQAVRDAKASREFFVIIAEQPCALIKDVVRRRAGLRCEVDRDKCIGCKACVKAGCPALSPNDGKVEIDSAMCNGCMICAEICPTGAISRVGEFDE